MLAERVVHFLEQCTSDGARVGQGLAHADRLAPLPGKDESAHVCPPVGAAGKPRLRRSASRTCFSECFPPLGRSSRAEALPSAPVCIELKRFRGGDAAGSKIATNKNETRSEEHTSELQSLMRISYAVFCLKKKKK